jgi:hypothetical protein
LRRVELTGEREIDRFESVAARVRRLAPEAHVVVIWEAGEEHESGSDSGLTALVVESDSLAV